MADETKKQWPAGQVAFLPTHSGDGYSWGGGIVVTIGEVAIPLGDCGPGPGFRDQLIALAHLLAAAPALLAEVERVHAATACTCKLEKYVGREAPCERCRQGALIASAKAGAS